MRVIYALKWLSLAIFTFFPGACSSPEPLRPFGPKTGCGRCHHVTLDAAHDLGCTACHGGNQAALFREEAHRGLVSRPAHPDHMERACGGCHASLVSGVHDSNHFTMSGMISEVWGAFFPGEEVRGVEEIPEGIPEKGARGLVADLLRRRCLSCHVSSPGDGYAGTLRGTGCAACHMATGGGDPSDHRFTRKVPDARCLSCHYGNFVGWDYYGRFERDYEEDFRAPLVDGRPPARPYGVEWHEMAPDVHRQAGMSCTDCHATGPCGETHGPESGPTCLGCHDGGVDGAKNMNPERIGHRPADRDRVDCAVCHAVWSFVDTGRNLLLDEDPFWPDWIYLKVQGSHEVERAVEEGVGLEACEGLFPSMTDKLTGEPRLGLWFQLYEERRWGPVPIGEDRMGKLRVMRPILDITVSHRDRKGNVPVVGLSPPVEHRHLPYTPHTIGMADRSRTSFVVRRLLSEGGR